LELLLDLDFDSPSSTVSNFGSVASSNFTRSSPQHVSDTYFTLLSAINSQGLSIEGRFLRSPSLFSNSMVSVELRVGLAQRDVDVGEKGADVSITPKEGVQSGVRASGQANVFGLQPGEHRMLTVGVDFGDSARPSEWTVSLVDRLNTLNTCGTVGLQVTWLTKKYDLQLEAPVGEQLEPIDLSGEVFEAQRASPRMAGMHQLKKSLSGVRDPGQLARELFKAVNCKPVKDLRVCMDCVWGLLYYTSAWLQWCYAAQTVSRKDLVLISLIETEEGSPNERQLIINCENVALASMLSREIEGALRAGSDE
jgi:Clathrin-adaptor complex-3 beta-1 subunit C-terminal